MWVRRERRGEPTLRGVDRPATPAFLTPGPKVTQQHEAAVAEQQDAEQIDQERGAGIGDGSHGRGVRIVIRAGVARYPDPNRIVARQAVGACSAVSPNHVDAYFGLKAVTSAFVPSETSLRGFCAQYWSIQAYIAAASISFNAKVL